MFLPSFNIYFVFRRPNPCFICAWLMTFMFYMCMLYDCSWVVADVMTGVSFRRLPALLCLY